jgi:glycopeptide antibiotics resistance protein
VKKQNFIGSIVGIFYLLLIAYLLFFASFREGTNTAVNLVPLRSISTDLYYIFLHGSSLEYILILIASLTGNLLILFPIPNLFKWMLKGGKKWVVVVMIPSLIEAIQYLLQSGSADIDDVILNGTGLYLGFAYAERRAKRSLPKSE